MRKERLLSALGVLTLVIPMFFGMFHQNAEAAGAVYYVDAAKGNDNNSGTSPNNAWKTLDKVEKTKFEPGDTIRLHEESIFDDILFLDGDVNGEGSDGAPITIESYGDAGGKATINGNGAGRVSQVGSKDISSAFTLYNASHWTIRNLAITNIAPGENMHEKSYKSRIGLYVLAKNNGLTQDIHVDDVNVSDVNGHWDEKDVGNGGIFFTVTGTPEGEITRFHNISVTNCYVENVTRTGISVGATTYGDVITHETEATTIEEGVIKQYGHTEVLIENNYVKQSGGDAIVPQFCYKPLVQYNVSDTASFSHSKWDLTSKAEDNYTWQVNAGIWPWLCYFPNFQFNEAFNTSDNYDGEAFDCDSGTGTIYQYNYSHDNEGGFMLICSPKNFDTLIRYNISQNDRKHLFLVSNSLNPDYNDPRYPGITEEETANVYNNTFYTGEGLDVTVMSQEEPGYVRMRNNIFYNEGVNTTPYWQPAHWGKEHPATIKYDHNLYYGYTNLPNNEGNPTIVKNPNVVLDGSINGISIEDEPQHERAVTEDEVVEGQVMSAPGTGAIGLDSVSGYQLSANSPAINAGTTIPDNGGRDYFGNGLVDGQTDIGAHEYSGETPPEPSTTESTSSSTEESSSTTESTSSSTEESSSTESSSSSTDESSSTKPTSSSTEEISSTKPTSSSTEESSSTKPTSSSTEESSSTKPTSSSTDESSSTKPTSSSTEESSSTKPTSSSTEESSSTKPTSSSTEESSSTKPTSNSTEESSSTKPTSSSTEESSSTKPTSSSTEESSSTKPTSSSTEESSSTKPTSSSTEESSSTKPTSSSTEESSSTKPTSSNTEESSSTKPTSSSTEESSSTKPTSSSTESSSSTKPTSSSTEESSSTKPTSSSTEESSSTKPTSSSTEESSSTKPTSGSTDDNSKTEDSTSSTEANSSTKETSESDNKTDENGNFGGNESPNTPSGNGGNKSGGVTVYNHSVNDATGSTKKELPKTGYSSNHLLVLFGVLLLVGSLVMIRKTNIVHK